MVSHEQVVTTEEVPLALTYEDIPIFADSWEAVWDLDNEAKQADNELPDNYLEILQKLMCKKKPSVTQDAPATIETPKATCAIDSGGHQLRAQKLDKPSNCQKICEKVPCTLNSRSYSKR